MQAALLLFVNRHAGNAPMIVVLGPSAPRSTRTHTCTFPVPCSLIGFPSCFYSCRSHGSCICLLAPTQSLVQSTDKHETSRPTADLVSHTGSGAAGGVLDDEPALDLLLLSPPPLPYSRLVSEAFQSRLFTVVITCALIDKVEKQH